MRYALVIAVVLGLVSARPALADDGDAVRLPPGALHVGEQVTVTLEIVTERGASVEVDPAAPSWNGVEVIRVASQRARDAGDKTFHTLDIVVAPFLPGSYVFQPVATVVADSVATPRLLPSAPISVLSVLAPDDPLEISPLAPPESVGGAESPLLRPAIAAGGGLALLLLGVITWLAARLLAARVRRVEPERDERVPTPGLGGAEELLERDPVGAYRRLAAAVRAVLAQRYDFPASALTTRELRSRMESQGVERWQARLVSGLLEECDAVVYAGYRPAPERRLADLTVAREIVEAT